MPDILKYKTKDEVPEGLRPHAEEKDGAVQVEVVPAKVHSEFRTNNIALLKERDDLKTKNTSYVQVFGEDIPKVSEELTELRKVKQQVDDGTLKTSDAVQKEVDKRAKSEQEGFAATRKALEATAQGATALQKMWESRYKGVHLDQAVAAQVTAADSGFSPSALLDIQARAKSVWRVSDDGTLQAVDAAGTQVYSLKEPGTPLGMKEWLQSIAASAPHFLKPSAGGGAPGGRGNGAAGSQDPAFLALPPAERMKIARERGWK
jgi:hypothetical protein